MVRQRSDVFILHGSVQNLFHLDIPIVIYTSWGFASCVYTLDLSSFVQCCGDAFSLELMAYLPLTLTKEILSRSMSIAILYRDHPDKL